MCLLGPPHIFISTILLSSLFYILGPVHYLLFTFQSLTPVFWFCIFYILILYLLSLNMCLLGPQLISISTIHSLFSLLYSMSYSLTSIHVSIYLQFNHLSVLISTFLSSVSGLFSPHFQVFSNICSSMLLSNSLQLLSQVHRDEYSNNPSAEIFNTCQCQLSTLHFMSLLVYNSLTFHLQSIVTTLSSNMI